MDLDVDLGLVGFPAGDGGEPCDTVRREARGEALEDGIVIHVFQVRRRQVHLDEQVVERARVIFVDDNIPIAAGACGLVERGIEGAGAGEEIAVQCGSISRFVAVAPVGSGERESPEREEGECDGRELHGQRRCAEMTDLELEAEGCRRKRLLWATRSTVQVSKKKGCPR